MLQEALAMKKISLFIILLTILASLSAQTKEHVYEVLITGNSPCSDPGSMPAAIEAMHLYLPTSFKRSGKTIQFFKEGEANISINPKAEKLWLTADKCMVRYTITIINPQPKPIIKRQIRISFSLGELENKGGIYYNSPLLYAVKTAIEKSRLSSGKAWIESISFAKDRFDAIIAFSAL